MAIDEEHRGDGVANGDTPAVPPVREAHDADTHEVLKADPSHEDAKADIALDESFPTSDAPGHAPPGSGEPAASSGFDEEAEGKIMEQRERAYALWEQEGRPEGRHLDHWQQAGSLELGSDPWIEGP